MVDFDAGEYRRWIATAQRQLQVARRNADVGFHDVAVLHAEQSAQCALKALLHAVGAQQHARGHSLVDLAAACQQHAGLRVDEHLRESMGWLSAQYQPTRYPDALPGGTPADHYGPQASSTAAAVAERTLAAVTAHFQRLQDAAEDLGGEDPRPSVEPRREGDDGIGGAQSRGSP